MLWKLGREKSNIFFYSLTKQIETFLRRPNRKKRKRSLDRIMTDSILLLSSDSFHLSLLHRRAVILSTLSEISAAENRHWKLKCHYINRPRPTNDPSWKVCRAKASGQWSLYSDDSLNNVTCACSAGTGRDFKRMRTVHKNFDLKTCHIFLLVTWFVYFSAGFLQINMILTYLVFFFQQITILQNSNFFGVCACLI